MCARPAHGAPARTDACGHLCARAPVGVAVCRRGWGSFSLPLGIPSKSEVREAPQLVRKHTVSSLQPVLGRRGQRAGRGICPQAERKAPGQHGIPLGDVAFTQPPTCHCLPGANQRPSQSGGGGRGRVSQRHSASDREEMAGSARRLGHSVSLNFFKCGWSPQGQRSIWEDVTHFHILPHVENWVAGFWRPAPIKAFSGLSIS